MGFTVTGPSGFTYSQPWSPWDSGETVAITITQPVLVPTTTTLTSSANPSVYRQPVTFTATVTPGLTTYGAVSGYVAFTVDGNTAVDEPIVNGVATYETTSLSVGTHKVVATYLGTSVFATSQATIASQVVNQASSTTTLAYSGYLVPGLPLSLTATVAIVPPSYGDPTGSVTFMDGTTALGTINLSGTASTETATLSLPTGLSLGSHSLTAVYSGDTNTLGSTSAALKLTVAQIVTETSLTTTVNPVVIGQPVTLTATVSPSSAGGAKPTGSVTFSDGTTVLGTVALSSTGVAQLPVSFTTPAGSHSLTAVYSGNATFAGSTGTLTQSVVSTPTVPQIYISPSANPAIVGQPVTFTVYVGTSLQTGVTGTVTLLDGTTTLGSGTLVNDKVSLIAAFATAGPHAITASYSGDPNFAAATSSVLTETINLPTPGTVIGQGTILNKQDSFTANVAAAVVYGVASYSGTLSFADTKAGDTFTAATITSVQLSESPVVVGPTTINGYFTITGTATLNGGTSAAYNFTASGSLPFPANAGSTGGVGFTVTGPSGFTYSQPWSPWDSGETVAITITQPVLVPTTTTLTSSANPSVYRQPVTFTATVTPGVTTSGAVSGYVAFTVDGNTAVDEPVVNGQAVYETTSLSVGTHKVVATYLGTSVFATSQATIASQVVNQASSTTTLAYSGLPGAWTAPELDGHGRYQVAQLRRSHRQRDVHGRHDGPGHGQPERDRHHRDRDVVAADGPFAGLALAHGGIQR